jgi:hypothetical protein
VHVFGVGVWRSAGYPEHPKRSVQKCDLLNVQQVAFLVVIYIGY